MKKKYSFPLTFFMLILIFFYFNNLYAKKSDPEGDRLEILNFFKLKYPEIELSDYVFGSLSFSNDAMAQYKTIMEFPPFEFDIEEGENLWKRNFKNGKNFSSCFQNQGKNIAGNYPYFDYFFKNIITFEMSINKCLIQNNEEPYEYDSREMGVLTAYARKLSDGQIMDIRISSNEEKMKYISGKNFFFKRRGQLNLSCANCHINYAGHYFRDEIISPVIGQATHFPVFRGGVELYTIQMRYNRCLEAIRANKQPLGGEDLNNLEYFHSFLSNGLKLKASVYRK